jgi:predicted RNA-binding protein with PIN domain
MPLIVDTYNVLHVTGVLPPDLAGIEPYELAQLIRVSRFRHDEAILVCDGVPKPDTPEGRDGLVSVRYAGPGRTADEFIDRYVNEDSAPRRITVVSSDHEVLRSARRRRCRTLTSEQFLRTLADDAHASRASGASGASPDPPSSAPPGGASRDVAAWTSVFGVEDIHDLAPGELPPHLAEHLPPSDAEMAELRAQWAARNAATSSEASGSSDAPAAPRRPAPPDPATFAALFPDELLAEAVDLDNRAERLPPILPPAAQRALSDTEDGNDDSTNDGEEPIDIDLDRIDELDMEAILRRRPPQAPPPPQL